LPSGHGVRYHKAAMGARGLRIASAVFGALGAWAAAAWAVLLSAVCIGDACSEDLRVTWWAWLALLGALVGTALVFRKSTARLGQVLLVMPIIVAVTATLVDT
jgi:hypothetical protein